MEPTFGMEEYYMSVALGQARIAFEEGEIPVGAVVVSGSRIIGKAYNQMEKLNDPTAHAEMLALTSAFNYVGGRHLENCALYVTLEPCAMCAGASYWGMVGQIIYGASDPKRGFSAISNKLIHPKTKVTSGVLAEEAEWLMKSFFKKLRH